MQDMNYGFSLNMLFVLNKNALMFDATHELLLMLFSLGICNFCISNCGLLCIYFLDYIF